MSADLLFPSNTILLGVTRRLPWAAASRVENKANPTIPANSNEKNPRLQGGMHLPEMNGFSIYI
jgi:hypothetical protein